MGLEHVSGRGSRGCRGTAAPQWAQPPPGPPLSPQCHLQAGHPRGALPEVISRGLLGGNAPSSPFCSVPKSATGALGPRRATKGNLVALLPAAPPAPAEHHGGSAPPCASPCPRLPPKRRRGGSPGSPPAAGAHALLFTSPLRLGGSARHELFPLPSADGEATRQLTHPTQLQKSVLTPSLLLLAHAASRRALRALFQPSAGCSGCSGLCAPRSRQAEVPQFTRAQPQGQNPSSHPIFPPFFPKLGSFASRALRRTRSLGAGCESSVLAFSMGCPCRLGGKGKKMVVLGLSRCQLSGVLWVTAGSCQALPRVSPAAARSNLHPRLSTAPARHHGAGGDTHTP